MKLTIVSADNHVMEPPGTFMDRVPAALKDRVPASCIVGRAVLLDARRYFEQRGEPLDPVRAATDPP